MILLFIFFSNKCANFHPSIKQISLKTNTKQVILFALCPNIKPIKEEIAFPTQCSCTHYCCGMLFLVCNGHSYFQLFVHLFYQEEFAPLFVLHAKTNQKSNINGNQHMNNNWQLGKW